MVAAQWPDCEIVDTAFRFAVVPVALYYLWDMKRRIIPSIVVKFRVTWSLLIFVAAFDRMATVYGKIPVIALVKVLQIAPGFFATSYLLQFITANVFALAFSEVPRWLTKLLKVLPIVFSILVCSIQIAWGVVGTKRLVAAYLLTTLLFVALSTCVVGTGYLRLYFYIKQHRKELLTRSMSTRIATNTERDRIAQIKKAERRALLLSLFFCTIPVLTCALIVRQIQGLEQAQSGEQFVPVLCDSFTFVWVNFAHEVAVFYITRVPTAKSRINPSTSESTAASSTIGPSSSVASKRGSRVAPVSA